MLQPCDRSFVYRLVELAARRGMDRKKFGLMGPHMVAANIDDETEEDVACYAAALAVWLARSPCWNIPDTPDETLQRMCFVLLRIKLIQAPTIRRNCVSAPPELCAALPGPEDDQVLTQGQHVAEVEMFSACFHFLGRVEHCLPVAYQTNCDGVVTPPIRAPFVVAEEGPACLHVYRVWRDVVDRTRNPGKLAKALIEDQGARRRVEKKRKRKRNAAAAVTLPEFSAYEIVRFVNTFTLRLHDFRHVFPEVLREEDGVGQWDRATA